MKSLTEKEVKSLMQTDAYSNRFNPDYEKINKKVTQAWENLYPEDDRNLNPEDYYVWRSRGDDKVRSLHAEREEKVFKWNNPPQGGHPGEDYNCRCWAEPYEPPLDKTAKRNIDYKLGSLSAQFESNGDSGAIGFDNMGGYSYGTYQIETRRGTMSDFINFLDKSEKYQKYSDKLRQAGGVSGAYNKVKKFEIMWQHLSQKQDFVQAQKDFIIDKKLKPLLNKIKDINGLNIEKRHPVIKDILYSMAVQHGRAADIIKTALGDNIFNVSDKEVIDKLYQQRIVYTERLSGMDKNTKYNILSIRFPNEHKKAIGLLYK